MTDRADDRDRMVDRQLVQRGIRSPDILGAMRSVPREAFVEPGFEEFAYDDGPLPIGEGQTISQPYIVALMAEAADLRPGDRVLDVGCGSGYSAAIESRIAEKVYAIERHAPLAEAARLRLQRLGYDNVEVRVGDGTRGWPEVAPFDAIVVAAGGPRVPQALKQQLAIGGRLVMPVSEAEWPQTLVKVTRVGESEFEQADLGAVTFVPLIGDDGWPEGTRTRARATARVRPPAMRLAEVCEPLPRFGDDAFGRLFDRFGDRRLVLLGEASHGTSEFYRARAAITRRLVEAHGFTIVALEADWPDAAVVDRYVRHRPAPSDPEPPFRRFPAWMWRNTDFDDFVAWLRQRNGDVGPERRAGVFGLDIYNLRGSIAAVLDYLDRVDPQTAAVARERYGCLTPWQREPSTYGRAVLTAGYHDCEQAVVAQCRAILASRLDYAAADGDSFLDAAQNARLVAAAERYYRIMYYGGAESWNLRDQHMFDTLQHLLDAGGSNAKAVVWAHNSHIGDARHTDMGAVRDELNLGQLCRQRFGDGAALIGFGTHGGTVAAATDWGGEMQIKAVRPAREGSYERLCHDTGIGRFLIDFRREPDIARRLSEPRLERFIGVIYRPETELASHYAHASLPQQFDAYAWFDETTAVTPLAPTGDRSGTPGTYPFGV